MTQATVSRPITYTAPDPEPRKYELLDVATVHDSGFGWLDPVALFDTFNCLRPVAVDWTCPPTGSKSYASGPTWINGTKFFVYLGATCKSVGLDQAAMEADIGRVFDLNESFAVEQRFQAAVLAGAGAVVAGNFTPQGAIALLEQDAATKYAGVPTLHMSRAIASLLTTNGQIHDDGGTLRTGLGSKVVAGGGYASTTMWATGEVTIVRGERNVHPVFVQGTNEVSDLAERAYVASADCYLAKVGVGPINVQPLAGGTEPTDPGTGAPLQTGADTVWGPTNWSAPSGALRSVTVLVTNGSITVDGDEVTAPNSVTFDADTGESLDPPTISADGPADRAIVSWVTT